MYSLRRVYSSREMITYVSSVPSCKYVQAYFESAVARLHWRSLAQPRHSHSHRGKPVPGYSRSASAATWSRRENA